MRERKLAAMSKGTFAIGSQARPLIVQNESIDSAVRAIGRAGFEAIEIGYQVLKDEDPRHVRDSLAEAGLALAGIHVGLDLETLGGQPVETVLGPVARLAETLQSRCVVVSGNRRLAEGGAKEWSAANTVLLRAKEVCRDVGGELRYHNHGWEFTHPELYERLTDGLGLAVDVAHLARAGVEPLPWLAQRADRIDYLHLRNIEEGKWTPEVGVGEIPLRACLETCGELRSAVVEIEPDPLHPELFQTWVANLEGYLARSFAFLAESRQALRSGAAGRTLVPREP